MQVFTTDRDLQIDKVNYCAFGGYYKKNTHLFHNLDSFLPKGTSGNGRCGGKNSKGEVVCPMAELVHGRVHHFFTIGKESHKEFSSEDVSRRRAKNGIPAMLTVEMTMAALSQWQRSHPSLKMPLKRKRK